MPVLYSVPLIVKPTRSEYKKAVELLGPGPDAAHSALGISFVNFDCPGGDAAVETALALKPVAIWL